MQYIIIKMIKSKIRNMGDNRKVIEVPKAVRDDFETGEEVEFQKAKANTKGRKR